MPNRKLILVTYEKLVTDIVCLYEGARRALVEAYWKIGQRIIEVEQKGGVKAAYGAGLLPKLSEDLTQQCGQGFSIESLKRMRRFYLDNPKRSPATELTWSQHIELLSIRDRKKRFELEKRATKEGLKRDELRELVQAELVREEVAQNLGSGSFSDVEKRCPTPLIPVRGTLYTYRILQPKLVGPLDSELLIDLGFSCYKDVDDITRKTFQPDTIVLSTKDAGGSYKLSAISSQPESLFTYSAQVEKVVDGDTLRVVVDLGFGIKTRQYLRLRGLDCPETDTPEGKKATDFVRSHIKQADQIVLTSSKSDKYDRYLADVYFTDSDGKEIFLNNLLLEQGLAVRMNE
jgi:endonuclease YncB( thermonuclease family)